MFTGLVQAAGQVLAKSLRPNGGASLTITAHLLATAKPGDSMAVNGCCLTVTHPVGDTATFDLLAETLRLTNLGDLSVGSVVNLEPSLLPSDRLGGHFVTGHIDCCAKVVAWEQVGADWKLDINAPESFTRYVVQKGCVAVDGMSLTVADLIPGGFRLWIIPHTLQVTNLSHRQVGDRVNLEADLLAKYAEKLLHRA